MKILTLQSIIRPTVTRRKFRPQVLIGKLFGYKYNEAPGTQTYLENPEQYCLDHGIIQFPSTLQMRGQRKIRIKDQ
jgi:hypothetical protein